MNKRQQEQFAAFFEEIYQTEELLDFIKLQLGQSKHYSPHLLFDLISQRQEDIQIDQMREYLSDKLDYSQRQLYQIFQRFDWSRQGQITRHDFVNQITPFGKNINSLNPNGGAVTAQIEGHFISLLAEIFKRLRIMQVGRKQLRIIQPYDAFQHIDIFRTGSLSIQSLRQFMFQNDFNVTDRQLYFLLHGLRRRCYRNVNLEVFCQNLDPLQFGQYLAYRDRIDQKRQRELLKRSRNQQESMRRSRLQAQRIQHQFQKAERKRMAEIQRQLELQDKASINILQQEQQKQRLIRKALLEEEKDIRYNISVDGELYRKEYQARNIQDKLQNQYLQRIRMRESEVNAALTSSALKRQRQLQRSKRIMEQEKQLIYRQEIQQERALLRSAAVAKQLQYSRRRIQQESQKRYQLQTSKRKDIQTLRKEEEKMFRERVEANRKKIEDNQIHENTYSKKYQSPYAERNKQQRQMQDSKWKQQIPRNRQVDQKELSKTRHDYRQTSGRREMQESDRYYR